MNDVPEPTLDLLSQLLGRCVARRLYRGSLTDLLLDENVPTGVRVRLRASRELVRRLMLEDLRVRESSTVGAGCGSKLDAV